MITSGITSSPFAPSNSVAIDASVGVAIDGVVLGRSSAASSDFMDIDRVEVLRGP